MPARMPVSSKSVGKAQRPYPSYDCMWNHQLEPWVFGMIPFLFHGEDGAAEVWDIEGMSVRFEVWSWEGLDGKVFISDKDVL